MARLRITSIHNSMGVIHVTVGDSSPASMAWTMVIDKDTNKVFEDCSYAGDYYLTKIPRRVKKFVGDWAKLTDFERFYGNDLSR